MSLAENVNINRRQANAVPAKRTELSKDAAVFFAMGPEPGLTAELEILVDGGPICVAPAWNWSAKERSRGLYSIYFKRLGFRFGPYYAEIGLAAKDMKKVLTPFPKGDFWSQSLEWYQRQKGFRRWIRDNMGEPEDLIGGQWAKEEKD